MNEKKSGLTGVRAWWLAIPGVIMLMALIIGAMINPAMLRAVNLRNIFMQCGSTLLIGAAIAIPFSRGQVDLSALGVAAFSGIIIGALSSYAGMPTELAMVVAVCISACIGLINGLIAMIFRRRNVLFTAAATVCIGMFYRYLGYAICGGNPIYGFSRIYVLRSPAFCFLLPVFLLIGVFALLSFTGGGRRTFNGIYEKDEDRNSGTIVPFLFSGIFAGLAAVLMVGRLNTAQPTLFGFNSSYILLPALAGIAIPNVKKSKAGAFLGFASVILAALAVSILQNLVVIIGMDSFAQNIIFSVLAVIFVILNTVIGSKASKIEYVPAPKAASASGASANVSAADAYAATGKSKVAAILLAIFLGPIGVHRYYLGYGKQGVFQTIGFACIVAGIAVEGPALYRNTIGLLVLALILLLIGLGTSIWAFVDFIRIITGGLKPACDYVSAAETRPTYVSEPVPTITPAEPAPVFTPAKEEPVFTPAEPAPVSAPAEKTKPSASSQFGALAELANLYENGLISEEVYLKRKNEIISNL